MTCNCVVDNSNSFTHNEEIQKLYEEMEAQIAAEKQQMKNEV